VGGGGKIRRPPQKGSKRKGSAPPNSSSVRAWRCGESSTQPNTRGRSRRKGENEGAWNWTFNRKKKNKTPGEPPKVLYPYQTTTAVRPDATRILHSVPLSDRSWALAKGCVRFLTQDDKISSKKQRKLGNVGSPYGSQIFPHIISSKTRKGDMRLGKEPRLWIGGAEKWKKVRKSHQTLSIKLRITRRSLRTE